MRAAIQAIILTAQKFNFTRLAIPAISTGIYGFDMEICARTMYQELKLYASAPHMPTCPSGIKSIRICLYDNASLVVFRRVLDTEFC
jgi:O-acetyl-ADP-ribose deacetylase (regulator of RNase III)